jgi:hypothetical protein
MVGVLVRRIRWILGDVWRFDPAVVIDQEPDRAIVAQAVKASRSKGQLDYSPHTCVSSWVAALYGSDLKKLIGSWGSPWLFLAFSTAFRGRR